MKGRLPIGSTMTLLIGGSAALLPALGQAADCTHSNPTEQYATITKTGSGVSLPNVVMSKQGHHICWMLDPSTMAGWSFARPPHPDLLAWKPANPPYNDNPPPAGEFVGCKVVSPTAYRCTNKNTTHGLGHRFYEYSLTITDPSGRDVLVDPWIVNL